MNWNDCFAERTRAMKRTAVRELLKLTNRPEIISFAGGLPAAELFPVERVHEAMDRILTSSGRQALQYGATEGIPELRDWIAQRFAKLGNRVSPSNVLIVSGAQQALDLIGRIMLDPGDCVAVENPTYLALLSAWRPLGVQFLPVKSDRDGLDIGQLSVLLSMSPKLLYSVPNFQNPQGTTLTFERRVELVRLLRQAEVGIIEDDPYGDLRYSGEALPHLLTLDWSESTDGGLASVIYVGTFSKVLMPGLRVGWVVAPEPVIEKLVCAKQAADLHTSALNQSIVWELVRDGFMDAHISVLRPAYRLRRDAMLGALEKHLPNDLNACWTRPDGGLFVFLTLPEGCDGSALLRRALEQKIAFVPGEEFHLDDAGRNTVRLNFSNVGPKRIEEGIARLGALLRNCATDPSRSRFTATAWGGSSGRTGSLRRRPGP
jgi:2-aminoadipate transaminase